IDNPLADPFDAELIGLQDLETSDIALKCTLRNSANEKVGIIAKAEGKLRIVEYTEAPEALRKKTDEAGELFFRYANLSLFCFSMSFIKTISAPHFEMPLHHAVKMAPSLQTNGQIQSQQAYKFEKFIFDLLPSAKSISSISAPRHTCFAPLKNLNE